MSELKIISCLASVSAENDVALINFTYSDGRKASAVLTIAQAKKLAEDFNFLFSRRKIAVETLRAAKGDHGAN